MSDAPFATSYTRYPKRSNEVIPLGERCKYGDHRLPRLRARGLPTSDICTQCLTEITNSMRSQTLQRRDR